MNEEKKRREINVGDKGIKHTKKLSEIMRERINFSRSTIKYPFPEDIDFNVDRAVDFIKRFWFLNRTAVSPDTDKLVEFLKDDMDAEIIEARSGEEVLSWIVPKRWHVKKGVLKRTNGEVIVDFKKNPLFLWSHSISFKGRVSREELLEHIVSDPMRPDEIIYHYRNAYKFDAHEWGFSLPFSVVKNMQDDFYDVEIEAELDTEGTLKVVNAFLPGERKETIFICAHTCHPAQVSDGIANIAIARELFFSLKKKKRKWSYRFIFGPEYFGGATFLAKSPKDVIEKMRYGIYLDMLSSNEPIGFQHSLQGNTKIDKAVKNILRSHTSLFIEREYRELWGNDETLFNGPDFLIPTVGIGRAMHREHHYSSDHIENMSIYHMKEAFWILSRIIEVFETDFIPIRNYKGILYHSRFGIQINPAENRELARKFEKVQVLADGKNSCLDIADELALDFFDVHSIFREMEKKKLITRKEYN